MSPYEFEVLEMTNLTSSTKEEIALRRRSCSFIEDVRMYNRDAVMEEFRMNGIESPYEPAEENDLSAGLSGLGRAPRYLKQMSCPADNVLLNAQKGISPIGTEAPSRNSIPTDFSTGFIPTESFINSPSPVLYQNEPFNINPVPAPSSEVISVPTALPQVNLLSEEQIRVLSSIPTSIINRLLKDIETNYIKPKMCRFCKNNGEREYVYKSHNLREEGRVLCPILRNLVCPRCGETGDKAHTIKYCRLTTPFERKKATIMMQNKRLSCGRRNYARPASMDFNANYVLFPTANDTQDGDIQHQFDWPLDPKWAALERKLMH